MEITKKSEEREGDLISVSDHVTHTPRVTRMENGDVRGRQFLQALEMINSGCPSTRAQ